MNHGVDGGSKQRARSLGFAVTPISRLLQGTLIAVTLASLVACGSGSSATATPSSKQSSGSTPAAQQAQSTPEAKQSSGGSGSGELVIAEPKTGTPTEKAKALWATTKPIVEADFKANLTDEQYQARRNVIYVAWANVQIANTNDAKPSDDVGNAARRCLELVDHLYGFPGTPKADREKERQNTERTRALIDEVDEMIEALK